MMPKWVDQYVNEEFESGTENTVQARKWMYSARVWVKSFLAEYYPGAVDTLHFRKSHFYWTAYFQLGEQWWMIDSGDVRYKICDFALVRKAKHDKDHSGLGNRGVKYDSDFNENLRKVLDGEVQTAW